MACLQPVAHAVKGFVNRAGPALGACALDGLVRIAFDGSWNQHWNHVLKGAAYIVTGGYLLCKSFRQMDPAPSKLPSQKKKTIPSSIDWATVLLGSALLGYGASAFFPGLAEMSPKTVHREIIGFCGNEHLRALDLLQKCPLGKNLLFKVGDLIKSTGYLDIVCYKQPYAPSADPTTAWIEIPTKHSLYQLVTGLKILERNGYLQSMAEYECLKGVMKTAKDYATSAAANISSIVFTEMKNLFQHCIEKDFWPRVSQPKNTVGFEKKMQSHIRKLSERAWNMTVCSSRK